MLKAIRFLGFAPLSPSSATFAFSDFFLRRRSMAKLLFFTVTMVSLFCLTSSPGLLDQVPCIFPDDSFALFASPNGTKNLPLADSLAPALDLLQTLGYSKMAALLDMELTSFASSDNVTVLAPIDENMDAADLHEFPLYAPILRRHVMPYRLSWDDLAGLDDGTELDTMLDGFTVRVTKSCCGVALLNGVPMVFPDLYSSEKLVIHGLQRLLVGMSPDEEAQWFCECSAEDKESAEETELLDLWDWDLPDMGEFAEP